MIPRSWAFQEMRLFSAKATYGGLESLTDFLMIRGALLKISLFPLAESDVVAIIPSTRSLRYARSIDVKESQID